MAKKNETALAIPEPITEQLLAPLFGEYKGFIEKYNKYSKELVIEDDDTLNAAENAAGSVSDFLKSVEDKRKEIKAPYADAVKAIDTFAKTIKEPLEEIKSSLTTTLTNYKRVQEAAARAERERAEEEANRIADEKAEEINRINRIESQLVARLFGGFWIDKNGHRKTSAGCQTPKDCENLLTVVQKSLPPVTSFSYKGPEYKKMIEEFKLKLSEQNARLIEMNSSSKTIAENAKAEAENARAAAASEVNNKKDEMMNEVVEETRKAVKGAEKEVKEAGKGVRKTIQFEVVDIATVPKEWIKIDEVAVREWATKNKELVKKVMKEGTGIINGIKFSLKETYVAR